MKDIIRELESLKGKREQQLNRETPGTYNEGWVSGEVSGIQKALDKIKEMERENNENN